MLSRCENARTRRESDPEENYNSIADGHIQGLTEVSSLYKFRGMV